VTYEVVLPNGDRATCPDRPSAERAAQVLIAEACDLTGCSSAWLKRELVFHRLDVAAADPRGSEGGSRPAPRVRPEPTPTGGHPMASTTRKNSTPKTAKAAADNATKNQPSKAAAKPKTAAKPNGSKAAGPVKITAAKGGGLLLVKTAPVQKAIAESGKSIQAVSREHGLNPSQMRRLSLGQVKRVDAKRAQAIAAALGQPVEELFEKAAAQEEAKA
jgi:Cro/C1-type HTH DNA-binding domain